MRHKRTLEYIGAARLYGGSLRIDVKSLIAVIPRSGVDDLIAGRQTAVYDISDITRRGEDTPIGQAWISRSGRAIMYNILGRIYASSRDQVLATTIGGRKYAGVSVLPHAE